GQIGWARVVRWARAEVVRGRSSQHFRRDCDPTALLRTVNRAWPLRPIGAGTAVVDAGIAVVIGGVVALSSGLGGSHGGTAVVDLPISFIVVGVHALRSCLRSYCGTAVVDLAVCVVISGVVALRPGFRCSNYRTPVI